MPAPFTFVQLSMTHTAQFLFQLFFSLFFLLQEGCSSVAAMVVPGVVGQVVVAFHDLHAGACKYFSVAASACLPA